MYINYQSTAIFIYYLFIYLLNCNIFPVAIFNLSYNPLILLMEKFKAVRKGIEYLRFNSINTIELSLI
jgi:hypothetical protein